jgi:hypothetical protein
MYSSEAFEALGPVFAQHGWVFFGPYRRSQGLSAAAGPYIEDQIKAAMKQGGIPAGAAKMIELLKTDHFERPTDGPGLVEEAEICSAEPHCNGR